MLEIDAVVRHEYQYLAHSLGFIWHCTATGHWCLTKCLLCSCRSHKRGCVSNRHILSMYTYTFSGAFAYTPLDNVSLIYVLWTLIPLRSLLQWCPSRWNISLDFYQTFNLSRVEKNHWDYKIPKNTLHLSSILFSKKNSNYWKIKNENGKDEPSIIFRR